MSKEYLEALERVGDNLEHHYLENIKDFNILKQSLQRLESIDNAEPSEALKYVNGKIADLEDDLQHYTMVDKDKCREFFIREDLKQFTNIKKALLKAQEPKQYVDELKLVEKKLKSLDLLMQELDCKDFAELRKYARCGYEKLNKNYLKWEDLEFEEDGQETLVLLNGTKYRMYYYKGYDERITLFTEDESVIHMFEGGYPHDKQFFNDLHLERVEE